MKFSGVTILQGVEFSMFPIDFEWALQQCSATALPVKRCKIGTVDNIVKGGDTVNICAIDLKRAFEKVNHKNLLANVNSRSRSLYAIARPSVVCLSFFSLPFQGE